MHTEGDDTAEPWSYSVGGLAQVVTSVLLGHVLDGKRSVFEDLVVITGADGTVVSGRCIWKVVERNNVIMTASDYFVLVK